MQIRVLRTRGEDEVDVVRQILGQQLHGSSTVIGETGLIERVHDDNFFLAWLEQAGDLGQQVLQLRPLLLRVGSLLRGFESAFVQQAVEDAVYEVIRATQTRRVAIEEVHAAYL